MSLGPIDAATAAASPVHGRVVLVATSDEQAGASAVATLGNRPGARTRRRGSGILVRGIPRMVGNYVTSRGEGLSALMDEQRFAAAARRLADEPLAALAEQTGAATVVDWSPGLEEPVVLDVAQALYPDATIVDGVRDTSSDPGLPPDLPPAPAATAPERSPFEDRVIFVLGAPRSGTTWLTSLLLAHPDAAGLEHGETWIFQALRDLWSNDDLSRWLTRPRLAQAVRRFVDDAFASHRDRTRPAATFYVEKSPAHVFRLPEMAATYPDAAYVHIVRDGRDVARSVVEMEHGTGDIAVAARYWAESVRAVRNHAHLLPRFREVRYEDLVADPVAGVTDLMTWAGLRVDGGTTEAVAARAAVRVSRRGTTGPVGPGKWRLLERDQLATVEREAGPVLVELGYAEGRRRRRRSRR